MTGMLHHPRAPSGSPVFRIAATDIGNWALRGRRALGSLDARRREARWDLEHVEGLRYALLRGVVQVSKDN